ncbi:hypothetical protein BDB13_6142 [Rhodococcus sp. OK302]|nr:hypothetical protein BDB13_6142 [Rhodococcus sp. OK302]
MNDTAADRARRAAQRRYGKAWVWMSKLSRILDREFLQRWTATVAAVLFPLHIDSIRRKAIEHPSAWNWIVVAVLAGGIADIVSSSITMWRKRLGHEKAGADS